jgi:hypothetical protein
MSGRGFETGSPRREVDLEHEHRIARDLSTGEWGVLNKTTKRVLFNSDMSKALAHAMAIFEHIKALDDAHSSPIIMPGDSRFSGSVRS